MNVRRFHFQHVVGFTLVEVMVSLAVVSVFMGAAVLLFLSTSQGGQVSEDYLRATLLAREGVEAVRAIRDVNFVNLQDGTYGLSRSAGYQLSPAPEVIDGVFERVIEIAPVYRDATGSRAAGATLDVETKDVSVRVSFPGLGGIRREVSFQTTVSNWTGREVMHTLLVNFSSLDKSGVSVDSTPSPPDGNGAISLASAFISDPFVSSSDIGDHGNDVVLQGSYAYVSTAKVQQGFSVVDMTDIRNMRVVQNVDVGGKGKGMALSGNSIGLGIENASLGFGLIDVSVPTAPVVLSRLSIGGIGKNVAFGQQNVVYVTTDRSSAGLVLVDITDPRTPSVIRSINIGADGAGVALYQNFLFVGAEYRGVSVYNVSDPRNPQFIQRFSMDGGHAMGIVVDPPYVYLAAASDGEEFFVARMDDTGALSPVIDLDLHRGNANDIALYGDIVVLAGDDENKGAMLVDVSNPENPTVVDLKDIDAKGEGVAVAPPYIGITTDTANAGFVVLGSGREGYVSSGEYTSNPIDMGTPFPEYLALKFQADVPSPGATNIYARSASSVSALASAPWAGPYTASPSQLTLPSERYAQYKVSLSGDGTVTPTIESITLQYLP